MPRPLRYQNAELQDRLASNYVTGTLQGLARRRMDALMREDTSLSKRVKQWEDKLLPLHQFTPEVHPKKTTWSNIINSINGAADPLVESLKKKLNIYKYFSGFALACVLVMAVMLGAPILEKKPASINYVAVMQDANEQPSMVVTLTKQDRIMALDMLQKPILETSQSLQLWAISKVDGTITSLGVIELEKHIEKSLTKPQWGLIKNAEYLMLSVEDLGGASHPSNQVVSKGQCVKVEGWNSKTS